MFTTFVIPMESPGGTLKIDKVNPKWGFTFLMSPSGWQYTTHFEILEFDGNTFVISIPSVKTNMRFNLEELDGETPTLKPDGLTFIALEQHRTTPHPGT